MFVVTVFEPTVTLGTRFNAVVLPDVTPGIVAKLMTHRLPVELLARFVPLPVVMEVLSVMAPVSPGALLGAVRPVATPKPVLQAPPSTGPRRSP